MLRTSIAKKRGKTTAKDSPRTPTRSDKKSNARSFAFTNSSSDKKKAKQPPTPESSSDSDSDNDGEFEVEAILGKKVNREGNIFYRIKWKGFDLRYATWEPAENVSNAPKLIENYEKSLKTDGNTDRGKRSTKDILKKRSLNELAGRKKGAAGKNNSRRKMTESEEEEEEEEEGHFYDDGTDEEEAEDQESDEEEGEEPVGSEAQEESSEEEEEELEEEKVGRKGKKAPVAIAGPGRKGAKKLKTETVSAAPVKEISKEKKASAKSDSTPVTSAPVTQENQSKKKQVGKLRIQEDIEEEPVVQQKNMEIEPQEEVKEAQEETPIAPMEITRLAMLEENEEKAIIPSKKNSLVAEQQQPQQIIAPQTIITTETFTTTTTTATQPVLPIPVSADTDVIKSMMIEEEGSEKTPADKAPEEAAAKPAITIAPTTAAAKPPKDDADHATNVLRELGRTSSAFKINVEAKSDFNNLLLTRNNSGFQQTGSAFQTTKTTTIIPKEKDHKTTTHTDMTPINPNPNSANPLLGLLHSKDSSALSLPFGAAGANPLLANPMLYGMPGMNMANNRPLDEEEARKNQIVFQGYLQISNYMLPQNNPMAMNNNRMRNMLGGGFPMNPLHNPFLPGAPAFPNYFGLPNPMLGANPLFPGLPGAMGMPALPNYFGPMGLAGANMPRNNMFNEMMKSGLSPSMLQGLQAGTGALTPSGASKDQGKSKGSQEVIIVDDKPKDNEGKKKEVSGEKR